MELSQKLKTQLQEERGYSYQPLVNCYLDIFPEPFREIILGGPAIMTGTTIRQLSQYPCAYRC
ncbi:MAG: hypothetical protein K0Q66_1695 [Chitinophagaceae bacterium]|nr:hypothetical protein [Chitinophagaceae bacterium]